MEFLRLAKVGQFEDWRGRKTFLVRKDGNEDYLNRVIFDAVYAERVKRGDVDIVLQQCHFDEWELDDGSHWVSVDGNFCSFQRIIRRVVFRLFRNKWIEKKNIRLINENDCRYWYINA